MKNIFTPLLWMTLFATPEFASSQSYHPFPDTLAQWSEIDTYCPFWDPGDTCATYRWVFSLAHDTIIDNKQYTLVGYNLTAYSRWVLGGQTVLVENYSYQFPGEIFGAIRESFNKRVWYRKLKDLDEVPGSAFSSIGSLDSDVKLYDFDANIGDTITWGIGGAGGKVVQSIDSVQLLNGEWRRRIWFNNYSGDDYWIEGMGSNLGLFGAYQYHQTEGGFLLTCFKQEDVLLYTLYPGDSTLLCNEIYTSTPNIVPANSISVFPNPSNDFVTFNFSGLNLTNPSLNIYYSDGRLIQNFTALPLSQLSIPASVLGHDGLYFYVLKSNGEKVSTGTFLLMK